ncbi:hypothetical protein PQU92_01895 [Asticcacaulis sp. BYS171W]|uniref:Lipoprotein n=1 Tax=Asticcacaulis aquaticus TaxID=2984212 RepID=A0ABT5HPL3_9CAUL|nr:hypothetical protein [Asticcacaulis aquaticus]MDC7682007.1 hypothetical protein [Asticcacaulis aquaticus]
MRGLWILAACLLSGCQTAAAVPARIDLSDPATQISVTTALAKAVGRARIELGPVDPDGRVITVLPPPPGPLETHATAVPIRFDIVREGGTCYAVRQDTKTRVSLPKVTCTAN